MELGNVDCEGNSCDFLSFYSVFIYFLLFSFQSIRSLGSSSPHYLPYSPSSYVLPHSLLSSSYVIPHSPSHYLPLPSSYVIPHSPSHYLPLPSSYVLIVSIDIFGSWWILYKVWTVALGTHCFFQLPIHLHFSCHSYQPEPLFKIFAQLFFPSKFFSSQGYLNFPAYIPLSFFPIPAYIPLSFFPIPAYIPPPFPLSFFPIPPAHLPPLFPQSPLPIHMKKGKSTLTKLKKKPKNQKKGIRYDFKIKITGEEYTDRQASFTINDFHASPDKPLIVFEKKLSISFLDGSFFSPSSSSSPPPHSSSSLSSLSFFSFPYSSSFPSPFSLHLPFIPPSPSHIPPPSPLSLSFCMSSSPYA